MTSVELMKPNYGGEEEVLSPGCEAASENQEPDGGGTSRKPT